MVTGGLSQLVSDFVEKQKKLDFDVVSKKTAKIMTAISAQTKSARSVISRNFPFEELFIFKNDYKCGILRKLT
jgi:hypothetical protein